MLLGKGGGEANVAITGSNLNDSRRRDRQASDADNRAIERGFDLHACSALDAKVSSMVHRGEIT